MDEKWIWSWLRYKPTYGCVNTCLRPLPVSFLPVLDHQLSELLVHLPVEVISQEKRPEAEQCVHLLGLADSQPLPLCDWSREEKDWVYLQMKDEQRQYLFIFKTNDQQRKRWTCLYRWGSAGGTCGKRVAWSRSPWAARAMGAGTWGGTEACSRCYPGQGCPLMGWR